VVHIHMAVSQSDGTVKGGHLFQAIVWPTLEIVVTVEPIAISKTKEADTGFALIDFWGSPALNLPRRVRSLLNHQQRIIYRYFAMRLIKDALAVFDQ